MNRFGYRAAQEFGYLNKKAVYVALNEQLRQEWEQEGTADPLGKICLDKKLLTKEQLDTILESLMMEPNISWNEETTFAKMLKVEKDAKQALGEYVGKRISKQPDGITIFLSNSSMIYYIFRGMVKYGASVNVVTIHAAILAIYPAIKSKIRSVKTIWKGRVDLDNALIEPDNLSQPDTKAELGFLHGDVTHAVISATGFDSKYGPMADNATAREVARQALQSETHTCIVFDHTKARINTKKSEPSLLFRGNEWNEIRNRGDLELIVTCHPEMPPEQASLQPELRSFAEIQKMLLAKNRSNALIDEVLLYCKWTTHLRDILCEIPFAKY